MFDLCPSTKTLDNAIMQLLEYNIGLSNWLSPRIEYTKIQAWPKVVRDFYHKYTVCLRCF